MTRLLLLTLLSISLFAQAANTDALFLSDAQVKRLNDTQPLIDKLTTELEVARQRQRIAILEITLESGATPDRYEPLALIDGKLGFKRKVEAVTKPTQ